MCVCVALSECLKGGKPHVFACALLDGRYQEDKRNEDRKQMQIFRDWQVHSAAVSQHVLQNNPQTGTAKQKKGGGRCSP